MSDFNSLTKADVIAILGGNERTLEGVDAVLAASDRAELTELRRRHQTLLDALDTDRSTVIGKRVVRAILKGR